MIDLISPTDAIFLLNESREHPMHVGSLQLFEPPEGAGPEFARSVHQQLLESAVTEPTFRSGPVESSAASRISPGPTTTRSTSTTTCNGPRSPRRAGSGNCWR